MTVSARPWSLQASGRDLSMCSIASGNLDPSYCVANLFLVFAILSFFCVCTFFYQDSNLLDLNPHIQYNPVWLACICKDTGSDRVITHLLGTRIWNSFFPLAQFYTVQCVHKPLTIFRAFGLIRLWVWLCWPECRGRSFSFLVCFISFLLFLLVSMRHVPIAPDLTRLSPDFSRSIMWTYYLFAFHLLFWSLHCAFRPSH